MYVSMCVFVVCIHMIRRNVFKVYKIDDRIWYTRNTAFSETWQNGASISSFSVNPSYRIPSGALTHSQRMKYYIYIHIYIYTYIYIYIYIYMYVSMCVFVVCIHMIRRNVFKVYKIDDRIWYTRNTAFSETWQNGASISSFSVNPSYRIPSGALTHSQRMKYHRETGDKPTNLGISESREETWYIISSQE